MGEPVQDRRGTERVGIKSRPWRFGVTCTTPETEDQDG